MGGKETEMNRAIFFLHEKLSLTSKLVVLLLVFAAVPMGAVAYIGFNAAHGMEDRVGKRFQVIAQNMADKIDRNLFERYGDVQAFGYNDVVARLTHWGDPSENNAITQAMNKYVAAYGIYYLTLLVDTKGQVIAVNSRDGAGNPIDTAGLYEKNYSHAPWFKALASNSFTTEMPFTAKGNDLSTGTFIEDLHVDSDVKQAYPGDDGLTLGFSAPVYNEEGLVIAYWSNRTKFSLVEEIFQQTYQDLKAAGFPGAELTLLDGTGRIFLDYDPMRQGSEEVTHDFQNVIMKLNLVEQGVTAAQDAMAGKTGFHNSFHTRKQIWQASGFSHFNGVLGYPGMNWSVLVRVPVDQANVEARAIQRELFMAVLLCLAVVVPVGMVIGRAVVRQMKPVMDVAEQASRGDLTGRVPVTTADELGQMGEAFNQFLNNLNGMIGQTAQVVQNVAAAAEQLSVNGSQVSKASREQSSQSIQVASSVEEMSVTANEMARNAQVMATTAQDLSGTAIKGGEAVANSIRGMEAVAHTMRESAERINLLGQRSQEIGEIIRVIEDIADQTNLLALNAAIEAARAGEQGRGFAVVADEVRKLAERTGKATKEISGVIETVQVGTKEAVASMGAGTTEVQSGVSLVKEAGARLNEIVEGVQQVTQMVEQMAASIEEQTRTTEHMAGGVQAVAALSQQNESSVEQVASASSDLSRMAAQLQSDLSRFTLKA